jgi:hypothetical protein
VLILVALMFVVFVFVVIASQWLKERDRRNG